MNSVSFNDERKRIEVTLDDGGDVVKWSRTFFRTAVDYGYDADGKLVSIAIWDDHGRKLVR